jgi:hypothetical protein
MKSVLNEEINSIKKLMKITEEEISVKDGEYSIITTDGDATSTDKINKALLDDIEAAAKMAGVKPVITTASSGHSEKTISGTRSRHSDRTAVDIAIIDGINSGGAKDEKSGSSNFRNKGNKLKDALVSMGYKLNSESGNPKAVLWQTNLGGNHYNHLHVSNTNPSPSTTTTPNTTEPSKENPLSNIFGSKGTENISGAVDLLSKLQKKFYLQEESVSYTKRISKENKNIVSYVDGEIVNVNYGSCEDYVTIYFVKKFKGYFLTYCGIENIRVREGQKVEPNSILGYSLDPVTIYFYDSNGKPLPISYFFEITDRVKKDDGEKSQRKSKDRQTATGRAFDRAQKENLAGFTLSMANHFLNPFTNRYDDKGKKVSSAPVLNPFKKEFYTQMVRDNFEPWDENKNYSEDDMVTYNGDTYVAIRDVKSNSKNPKDSGDWELEKIQGNITQLYKYDTQSPNGVNEEINRIKELLK